MMDPVIQPFQGWPFFWGAITQGRPIELANPGLDDCHPFRLAGWGGMIAILSGWPEGKNGAEVMIADGGWLGPHHQRRSNQKSGIPEGDGASSPGLVR